MQPVTAMRRLASKILKRWPPIRRRETTIASLKLEIASERSAKPSFTRSLQIASREHKVFSSVSQNWSDISGFTLNKFGVKALGESLGVHVPEIYGTWDELEAIDPDSLPDAIVVKANSGSDGSGVLPLFRDGREWRVGSSSVRGDFSSLIRPLQENLRKGKISGPFFVEQLLGSKDDHTIQNDIKIYSFYGQPGIAWIRKSLDFFGGKATKRSTFFDIYGRRVLNAVSITQPDHTIELPRNFDEALRIASQLSLAIRLPQVRVDMYESDDQIFLGEITPFCGHRSRRSFGPAWDEYLGTLWEHAHVRLLADLAIGHINASGPVVRTGAVPIPSHLSEPPTNHG